MNTAHAAVVLAAGGSRRLGTPKQLLMRDGEPLVHRAARLCGETGARRVVVAAGAYADAVAGALGDLDVHVCINAHWQDGLAGTLQCAAGALHAHDGPVLVVGCDQPALDAGHLRRLLDGAARAASGCAATAHGAVLGAPAVLPSRILQQATALSGDQGFGPWLTRLPAGAAWILHAPELQLDIDTEPQRRAAIAQGLLDPG